MKNIVLIVLTALISLPNLALAGRDGGGGAGIVCPADSGYPDVRLLDLAEAEGRFKKQLPQSDQPYLQQLSAITETFKQQNLRHAETISATLNYILSNYELVENVPAANDIGKLNIQIPPACSLQWIAFYPATGKLQINLQLLQKLSETEKAALFMHETVFRLAKFSRDEETSEMVRRSIGSLFLNSADMAGFANWVGYLLAKGTSVSSYKSTAVTPELLANAKAGIEDAQTLKLTEVALENGDILHDCQGAPDVLTDISLCMRYENSTQHFTSCQKIGKFKAIDVKNNTRVETGRSIKISGAKINKAYQKILAQAVKKGAVSISELQFSTVMNEGMGEICEFLTYDGPYFSDIGSSKMNFTDLMRSLEVGPVLNVTGNADKLKAETGYSATAIEKNGYEAPKAFLAYGTLIDPLGVVDMGVRSEIIIELGTAKKK